MMTKTIRNTVLAALVATAGAIGFAAPSNAQAPLALGSTTMAHLFPTTLPYIPGTVPSDCLAYPVATPTGLHPVVFCEKIGGPRILIQGMAPVDVQLFFRGYYPVGTHFPDNCVARVGALSGRIMKYCK
jgi:hypothetical protein